MSTAECLSLWAFLADKSYMVGAPGQKLTGLGTAWATIWASRKPMELLPYKELHALGAEFHVKFRGYSDDMLFFGVPAPYVDVHTVKVTSAWGGPVVPSRYAQYRQLYEDDALGVPLDPRVSTPDIQYTASTDRFVGIPFNRRFKYPDIIVLSPLVPTYIVGGELWFHCESIYISNLLAVSVIYREILWIDHVREACNDA